jgi:hypothetical protein
VLPAPQRANAGPDQSFLDFRSSSAATQTIQLARGQTISRTLFAPGSVEACWSRFAEAQGRYRQDILGRIIGLDNEVGITCTRTRVRQACPGVSIDPTVGLVAHPLRVPYARVASASG